MKKIKSILKSFVPPILLPRSGAIFRPEKFLTYGDALKASGDYDYEQEQLIDVVLKKNSTFREQLFATRELDINALRTIIGLGLIRKNDINVLDFGGGGGSHLAIAELAFGKTLNLKWNIVETPGFVSLASDDESRELKYFSNLIDAKNNLAQIDLIFCSSSLQYCRDPLTQLENLTQLGAKNIYITRTPFTDSINTIFSVQSSKLSQNGPGPLPDGYEDCDISYPISYVSWREVERILGERYEIQFRVEEGAALSFRAKDADIRQIGYFCSLR